MVCVCVLCVVSVCLSSRACRACVFLSDEDGDMGNMWIMWRMIDDVLYVGGHCLPVIRYIGSIAVIIAGSGVQIRPGFRSHVQFDF